jgi:hypothetical protein
MGKSIKVGTLMSRVPKPFTEKAKGVASKKLLERRIGHAEAV